MDYQTIGVGVAIILAVWRLNHSLRQDLGRRIDRLEDRIGKVEDRLSRVEQGQARLEGLLEGLRDLFGRKAS